VPGGPSCGFSWEVEGFFGILGKQSLGISDFPSKSALRQHIDAYVTHWNDEPTPLARTKPPKLSSARTDESLRGSRGRCTRPNAERIHLTIEVVPVERAIRYISRLKSMTST
jgi:hypothetical protein